MIRVRQVRVSVDKDCELELKRKVSLIFKCGYSLIRDIKIIKKSLDARYKPDLFYVYEVDVVVDNEIEILKRNKFNQDISLSLKEEYVYPNVGECILNSRPVIVGSGPAGLFCAYLLAEKGFNPIIIERGERLEKRVEDVTNFWRGGELKLNSNVQFGEGGAGTFSDGKLNTLVKDKANRGRRVFEIFVECGASPEIMYLNNPHIGTDKLRDVMMNMRNKINKMGGEFFYNTTLTNILSNNGRVVGIEVNNSKIIKTDVLVLAIGHSARDTFSMLSNIGLFLEPKPFAVGLRIQHSQEMINKSQYGDKYYKNLPPASYKLTYKTSTGRGVYSFCMCPGGYVVNASSERGCLAINGMSYNDRGSENANSAIVVTVSPDDYGKSLFDGVLFQRRLESACYKLGDGNIPIQKLKDFHNSVESSSLGNINPVIKGNYKLADLNEILPDFIKCSIKEALINFDKKIEGFNDDNAIIAGIESRTSSPIRILRDESYQSNVRGIYPAGEGAGYAGGITTSAIDGIKIAEAIMKFYCPFENN